MKYAVKIEPCNAILEAGSRAGIVTAEIDLSQFNDAERKALCNAERFRPAGIADDAAWYHEYPFGILNTERLLAAVRADICAKERVAIERLKNVEQEIERARKELAQGLVPCCCYEEARAFVYALPEYIEAKAKSERKECEEREAKKAAAMAAEAAKSAEEAKANAERLAWIQEHGSERLRRCVKEGIECLSAYSDERLFADRPGWLWWFSVPGKELEPRNPPCEAFALLDEARKSAPDARLVYVVVPAETDEETGEETRPESRGYAALAEFLGREIVYGDLWD